MNANRTSRELVLKLRDIRDLFDEPNYDPFSPFPIYVSGLDHIAYVMLKSASLRQQTHLRLLLPPEKAQTAMLPTISGAVQRCCEVEIRRIEADLASLRGEAIKSVQVGLVVLACGLFLSSSIGAMTFLPDFLRTFLAEGCLIAGWVGLWRPAEIVLYDWWPHRRELNVFRYIQAMPIVIEADQP